MCTEILKKGRQEFIFYQVPKDLSQMNFFIPAMTFTEASCKSSSSHTCLELAREAERLCKTTCDYAAAIHLFRQALAIGTDDISVLSAIYSQLGNAYFYQHDFLHALEFHRWDLSLSR